MGHSWSSRRHNHHDQPPNQNPSLPQSPPPLSPPTPPPSNYAFAANAPSPPNPILPSSNSHPSNAQNNASRPMMSQSNYHHPYYSNPNTGRPAPFLPPVRPPPPYVDHHDAKKIKNDVNVHKDSIRVDVDENNKDYYLVSFTFDAIADGSISIFYLAKEGANCTFTPVYPEIHIPARIPFQKGLGQKFYQPSGMGIDLGFFDMDDLSKLFPGDAFPLVICAESCLPSLPMDEHLDKPPLTTSSNAQITQAVLEKINDGHFQAKVIEQILWADGVRYKLREIYGINNSTETTTEDQDLGKECIICMTDPKDTAVLPCRHMCMCSGCAKELRLQSDKCPICRQPIEELIEITVDEALS